MKLHAWIAGIGLAAVYAAGIYSIVSGVIELRQIQKRVDQTTLHP